MVYLSIRLKQTLIIPTTDFLDYGPPEGEGPIRYPISECIRVYPKDH